VHRLILFDQSPWLKTYIELNTKHRTNAKNNFEKDFFKLMNNSVFGKQMENLRKRTNVFLCLNDFTYQKQQRRMAGLLFSGRTILDEDLALVRMSNKKIKLSKPMYGGFTVLELSKHLMYDFYYNYLKNKYGNNLRLLMTDTDSLCIEVKCHDFYSHMKEDSDKYDTSDFAADNPYGIQLKNKKVPGLFKDEMSGKPTTEFVGLRRKLYSFRTAEEENKTCKGIKKKSVVKNTLKFEEVKHGLFDTRPVMRECNTLRSYHHEMYSITTNEVALSAFVDKRYLVDKVSTLP